MNEDTKIYLKSKDGQEFFIYKTEKCDMQKELTETINNLQQENQQLKIEISARETVCDELQDRINKVIEILEPFTEWDLCTLKGTMLKTPIKILKGDKE